MSLKYDAIIFDFDGVILQSVEIKSQAFYTLYAPYGPAIANAAVQYHLAYGGISRYEKFKVLHQQYLGITLTDTALEQLGQQFSELVREAILKAEFVPGAPEFLQQFKQKLKFFIVSGTPELELQAIVAQRELTEYFELVLGSPIPKPISLQHILSKFHYVKERVLFVGDALTDYQAAQNVEIPFCGVGLTKLEAPEAHYLITDLSELPRWIV